MLTTAEAAEILGVTPRRVVALVESGTLSPSTLSRGLYGWGLSVSSSPASSIWRFTSSVNKPPFAKSSS